METVYLLETHWRLTPDERVAWTQAVSLLNPEIAEEAMNALSSASRSTPSIALFMASYNGIVRSHQRAERRTITNRSDGFEEQREVLRQAKLRRERSHRVS